MSSNKPRSDTDFFRYPEIRNNFSGTSGKMGKNGSGTPGFMEIRELLDIVQPTSIKGPEDGFISGISIDSRKSIGDNFVFWAIKGKHFNGNDFVETAISHGASAVVVSRPELLEKASLKNATLILGT